LRRHADVCIAPLFVCTVSYIYVTGVLLQAWNCFVTSDGVSKMRNDPNTICTSASHLNFRKMATAIIIVVGPGVPLGYAFWIRRLRRVAANEHLLARSAWRGLADPMTRGSWGACAAHERRMPSCWSRAQAHY
jgi:hypothetical protein